MMTEVISTVHQDDPTQGDWCVTGEVNTWVDASCLAMYLVLERHDAILEYTCWLSPANDANHINLAELHATLKVLISYLDCVRAESSR